MNDRRRNCGGRIRHERGAQASMGQKRATDIRHEQANYGDAEEVDEAGAPRDETKRAEGRQFVLWGILGLVVLFSVWALVNILLSTFGIAPQA